jgi:hypothetical protein
MCVNREQLRILKKVVVDCLKVLSRYSPGGSICFMEQYSSVLMSVIRITQ